MVEQFALWIEHRKSASGSASSSSSSSGQDDNSVDADPVLPPKGVLRVRRTGFSRDILTILQDLTPLRRLQECSSLADRLQIFSHTQMLRYHAANQVWNSALALAEFVDRKHNTIMNMEARRKGEFCAMIELGCGLGVTGMLAHKLSEAASVSVLTDFGDVCCQVEQNLHLNNFSNKKIFAVSHDWGDQNLEISTRSLLEKVEIALETGKLKRLLVLCADCVHAPLYGQDCVALLVSALRELFRQTNSMENFLELEALITVEHRSPDDGTKELKEALESEKGAIWRTYEDLHLERELGDRQIKAYMPISLMRLLS